MMVCNEQNKVLNLYLSTWEKVLKQSVQSVHDYPLKIDVYEILKEEGKSIFLDIYRNISV